MRNKAYPTLPIKENKIVLSIGIGYNFFYTFEIRFKRTCSKSNSYVWSIFVKSEKEIHFMLLIFDIDLIYNLKYNISTK